MLTRSLRVNTDLRDTLHGSMLTKCGVITHMLIKKKCKAVTQSESYLTIESIQSVHSE